MIKNRIALEEQLNEVLDEINMKSSTYGTKKIKESIMEGYMNKGLETDEVSDIFSGRMILETLPQIDLCLFSRFLYDAINEQFMNNKKIKNEDMLESINPKRYFSEMELKTAEDYYIETEKLNKYPIIIPNVKQLNDNQWYTSLSVQQILDLYNRKVVIYDPEMQRSLKIRKRKGKIISRIDINRESILDIKSLIKKDQFISNFITFNILENGEEDFFINDNGDLQINSGKFLITDGFHRNLSFIEVANEEPDIQFNTGVMITHFDKEKVGKFIVQEDKRNPINKEHLNQLDTNNPVNIIVKKINEKSKSHLKDKIVINRNLISKDKGLILFSILSDTIKLVFNPKTNKEILTCSEYIMKGLNFIMETNTYLLDKPQDDRLWIAYLLCIKNAINADDFEERILSLLCNINNESLLKISYNGINQSLINRIEKELNINV